MEKESRVGKLDDGRRMRNSPPPSIIALNANKGRKKSRAEDRRKMYDEIKNIYTARKGLQRKKNTTESSRYVDDCIHAGYFLISRCFSSRRKKEKIWGTLVEAVSVSGSGTKCFFLTSTRDRYFTAAKKTAKSKQQRVTAPMYFLI